METIVTVQNHLIPVEKINVPEFFQDKNIVLATLEKIKELASAHEPDLSTATSRKAIASNANDVARSKTFLDGLGKQLADKQKADAKITDQNRKLIRDTLDELKRTVRQPLTDYETAEKEREERELAEKQYLSDWDDAIHENDLFDRQREIERKEAEIAKHEAERKAKEEAERLEKERIEREERLKKEAADKAKKEAEEKAEREKAELERKHKEAVERAEREKKEAELAEQRRIEAIKQAEIDKQRAVEEAERKERERIEAEQRRIAAEEAKKKEAADRRSRHKAHQKIINNEALTCFVKNGYDKESAKKIIELIARGEIEHVTIIY